MNVLIAGGGTGGHLFPGIAVAEELRRRDPTGRILFVGTARGIETRAVPKAGFDLELLPVAGLRGKGVAALGTLVRLPWALLKAIALVRRFRPDVAVSVGGYAAGPAVLAARLCRVPAVVMEQNAVPGVTNRVLGRLAQRVLAGLPTRGFASDKTQVVGNPVRESFLAVREQPYRPSKPLRLLVFGGSQGARALNEVMLAMLPTLPRELVQVVHQTGRADAERVATTYRERGVEGVEVLPFIDDMAGAFERADLVLCRAGAMTLAELAVCGRPAILVPFPFAVDDHQTANGRALVEAGAALLIPESRLSPEGLASTLRELAAAPDRLSTMAAAAKTLGKPAAASTIADVLGVLGGATDASGGRHV